MVDEVTKKSLGAIPLLRTKAGPRDKDEWMKRLKEEYQSLIKVSICMKSILLMCVFVRLSVCPLCIHTFFWQIVHASLLEPRFILYTYHQRVKMMS